MRLEQNPIYRKEIIPWYDGEIVCFVMLFFMVVVLLFGAIGISVARSQPIYHSCTWVPVLTVVLSGSAIVSLVVRLIKRHLRRTAD